MRHAVIAGNWKMYKTPSEARAFVSEFKKIYKSSPDGTKVIICGPYTTLDTLVMGFKDTDISVGAQNVHYLDEGAYTGEISAAMLKDLGVEYCIVGHSERRRDFNDTDETVNKKIKNLISWGITPILCVGEDEYQRNHNFQDKLVAEQVKNALEGIPAEDVEGIIIAYEPIWAIGTGRTATPIQAGMMCRVIRDRLVELYGTNTADRIYIQYGGSVKPENISEIMANDDCDGALVGGASLDPGKFMDIISF